MTLQELQDQLEAAESKLKAKGIRDKETIKLEILIEKIRKKRIVASFDALKEIPSVEAPDIDKLPGLIDQVDIEIQIEEKRKALIGQVMSIAKTGLKAIGLPGF